MEKNANVIFSSSKESNIVYSSANGFINEYLIPNTFYDMFMMPVNDGDMINDHIALNFTKQYLQKREYIATAFVMKGK